VSYQELHGIRNVLSDRYAIYLRKSRADLDLEALGEGETLARHHARLMELAARYNIHPDQITVYKEIVSGESLQDRPEAQRLLNDVYAKMYKGVLVVEVERLARGNTKDQGEVADAFTYSSTYIITPTKVYDPNNEFDEEYFEFGLFMSRREYKTIRRRMTVGKQQSAEQGNYLLPQPPFGYDIVTKGKHDRYLVINEENAAIVRMMFDWFTEERRAIGWITRQLTRMGIPTVGVSKEWERSSVKDMLKNPHYTGVIIWGKQRTVKKLDPKTGKTMKKREYVSAKEVPTYPGKHKAIISKEQFDKAQELFKMQLPTNTEMIIKNPLAGLLRCADCGRSMSWFDAKHGREIRYTHRHTAICSKKSLPVNVVLEGLTYALEKQIEDMELKLANNGNQEVQNRHRQMVESMKAELKSQEKKRSKLFDDYEDGTYTKEEFIERKQKYNTSIEALKEQIADTETSAPTKIDYKEKISTLHCMINVIRDPELTGKEKNDFLRQVIEDIRYDVIDYGKGKGGKPVLDVALR